jgi:hypothetical protein
MIRKVLSAIVLTLGFAACGAGAHVGPVHAGGGVASTK